MFHQVENNSSPILDWDFCIRYKRVVADTVGWPTYTYMPDGHISTLQVLDHLTSCQCLHH